MSARPRQVERGQTLLIWVGGILLALGLLLFIVNYANTLRWQVRAQNAADSAAVALLASDANAANSMTTLLYALSIHDFKLSTINNTLNSLLKDNAACALQTTCSAKLTALLSQYAGYAGELPSIESGLSSFTSSLRNGSVYDQLGLQSQTDPSSYADGLITKLMSGNTCVNVLTNCSEGFAYSVAVVTSVPLVVDVVACKNVPSLAATFLHLSNGSFKAIGRATVKLSPLGSTTNAGTLVSGLGSSGISSTIPLGSSGMGLGNIDLTKLSVTTGYLIPAAVSPLTAANVPC